MSNLNQERVCDGCGRAFDADTSPAMLGDHRDYCGHCAFNREGDYELERGGRRVMASALKAEPGLLDPPPAPPPAPPDDDEPRRSRR